MSRYAPAVEIVYKIAQYGNRGVFKTSPGKGIRPGRKRVTRVSGKHYQRDIVSPLQEPRADDLLKPFESAEQMPTIQQRLAAGLVFLDEQVIQIVTMVALVVGILALVSYTRGHGVYVHPVRAQLAEVAVPRGLYRAILDRIRRFAAIPPRAAPI